MHPPRVPACFILSVPNFLPMPAPQALMANVMIPMAAAGMRISCDSMDMDMPTIRASMLVATARVAMVTRPRLPSCSSSSERSSLIMFNPIRRRMAKATQCA